MKYNILFIIVYISLIGCDQIGDTTLDISNDSISNNTDERGATIFGGPEASFPGGDQSLAKYIQKEFDCIPETMNSTGGEKIIMRFTVDKNGELNNVEVIQAQYKEYYDCYINFIKNMPLWNPACYKNECIKVTFTLPINLSYR